MLRLGLGRAILFLRQHEAWPYRNIILNACTHWTGYDQQLEGTRTTYLRAVLDATGHESAFVKLILAALKTPTERRDANQLTFLALSFAEDGYDEARTALYEKFDQNDAEEAFLGYDAIIRLDGLEGFLYVAERMGAAILNDLDVANEAQWTRLEAQDVIGKEAVQQILTEASTPALRAFARALQEDDEASEARSAARPNLDGASYEQVRQAILEAKPTRVGLLSVRNWATHANEDDLARAAADLLAETDDHRLTSYLRIFERRAFPFDPEPLLALVDHPNDMLMIAATLALSRVSHPQVRARGLEILADPGRHGSYKSAGAQLLVSSYAPGDEVLLANLLTTVQDPDEHHHIGMAARDLIKAQPSADARPIQLALYEYGPCSFCRKLAVDGLHERGQLPDWMLEECLYDANFDIREAAEVWERGEEPAEDS